MENQCEQCGGVGFISDFTAPEFYEENGLTRVIDPVEYRWDCPNCSDQLILDIHSPEFLRQT